MFLVNFFPGFLLFYPLLTGADRWWTGMRNQGLVFTFLDPLSSFGTAILQPGLFWFSMGWFFIHRDELVSQGFTTVDLFSAIGFFVGHKVLIAVKYGFQSPEEVRWFLNERDYRSAKLYNLHRQLISGWFRPSRTTIDEELRLAQARLNIKLTEDAMFRVDVSGNTSESLKWRRLLGERTWNYVIANRISKSKSIVYVDGSIVTKAVVHYSVQNGGISKKSFTFYTLLGVALQCSMTGLSRVLCEVFESNSIKGLQECGHGFFGDDYVGYVFGISATLSLAIGTSAYVGFMLVTLNAIKRRLLIYRRLGKLIAFNATQSFGKTAMRRPGKYPVVDARDPREIYSWLLCRLVVHDFGAVRRRQIAIVVSVGALATLVLIVWFFVSFIQHFDTPAVLRNDILTQAAFFEVAFFAIFAFFALSLGSAANEAGESHVLQLIQHRTKTHLNDDDGFNSKKGEGGVAEEVGDVVLSKIDPSTTGTAAASTSSASSAAKKLFGSSSGGSMRLFGKKKNRNSQQQSSQETTDVDDDENFGRVRAAEEDLGAEDEEAVFDPDLQPDLADDDNNDGSSSSSERDLTGSYASFHHLSSSLGGSSVELDTMSANQLDAWNVRLIDAGIDAVAQTSKMQPITFLGTNARDGGPGGMITAFGSGMLFAFQSVYLQE